jgi:hypothetical protein
LSIEFYNLSPIKQEENNNKTDLRKKFNVNNLPTIPTLEELKANKIKKLNSCNGSKS